MAEGCKKSFAKEFIFYLHISKGLSAELRTYILFPAGWIKPGKDKTEKYLKAQGYCSISFQNP